MASRLTTISDVTKKGFIVLVIAVILFFVGKYTITAAYHACCVRPSPTPTPYMNPLFGQLEFPSLPSTAKSSANLNLTLDTISGTLPEGSPSAMIYELVRRNPELNYAQRSQQIADYLGFKGVSPTQTETLNYFWQNPTDPNMKLDIDIAYYNFNFRLENASSYIAIAQGVTPDIQNAINAGYNTLQSVRQDIERQVGIRKEFSATAVYLYQNPTTGEIKEVSTQQQANVTKINLTRNPILGIPIIDPWTKTSLISFTHTGITQGNNSIQDVLLEAQVKYWTINTNPKIPAVYPLRSTQDAWQELQDGKGYILSESNSSDQYHIRTIYLAYYNPPVYHNLYSTSSDPNNLLDVMQPVWVFEGDKEGDTNYLFRAFVPAIHESYIKTQ
jgi:hypothetical protein